MVELNVTLGESGYHVWKSDKVGRPFSEATKRGLGGHGLQREAVGSMVIDHKVEPPFQHIVTKLSRR